MGRRVIENVAGAFPARDKQLRAMEKLAKGNPAFVQAREVLTRVRAVPTIFPDYDHAIGVGGHPIERATTIHGPSNEGKTLFLLGIILSFLRRGHFAKLVDAEYTTEESWLQKLMGPIHSHPGFTAIRPKTYEETVDDTRKFVTDIDGAVKAGDLHPETSGIIVVDSIRKLTPAGFFKKVLGDADAKGSKKGSKANGVDGYGGRGAQIKAGLNAAWLDELTPLLYHTHTAIVFIARESEDTEADANDRKWGKDFKVGGGKALIFDASNVARIERAGWVYPKTYEQAKADDDRQKPIGERHRVTITKTKVAGKQDKTQVAYFHSSNGAMTPEGFDLPRDLVEMGKRFGVLQESGSWVSFGRRKWQGKNKAVLALHEDPGLLAELDAAVRAKFSSVAPVEA